MKRGVYEAGGFPLEFPVMSLGESNLRPTAMLFRNLASMDVEESIRGNPLDGVVLLTGCDKTTPALVMGAASCDVPAIVVSGGPMLNGHYRDQTVGSGTSVWQLSEDVRGGKMSLAAFMEAEAGDVPLGRPLHDHGHGLHDGLDGRSAGHRVPDTTRRSPRSIPGAMCWPISPAAAWSRWCATISGISKILTRKAFENAIRVNGAIGGSTNAVIHLLAIAGRIGVDLSLDDWDKLGQQVPCLVNLMPSGKYLMEDFYYAGGLPAVMRELGDLIHGDAMTVSGKTVAENIKEAECFNRDVIMSRGEPFKPHGRHRGAARQPGA